MQNWNWPAIKKCVKLIRKPSLLNPKLSFESLKFFSTFIIIFLELSDIDWIHLKENYGIKAICFDKDNTITAPYSHRLHFSVIVLSFWKLIIILIL